MHDGDVGRRVLLAEDDESLSAMMVAVLRRHQMRAATARDGHEAIECMKHAHYNVLIIDLMMPRVSGWEVIAWLRRHPEHRPDSVLVVTAADRVAANTLDPQIVNAVFFKPFDIEQFGGYVSACGRRQAPDRRRKRVFAS